MFTEFNISFNIKGFYTFPTVCISVFCMNVKKKLLFFIYSELIDVLLLPRSSVFTVRYDPYLCK
jgi:hypothetical protein